MYVIMTEGKHKGPKIFGVNLPKLSHSVRNGTASISRGNQESMGWEGGGGCWGNTLYILDFMNDFLQINNIAALLIHSTYVHNWYESLIYNARIEHL